MKLNKKNNSKTVVCYFGIYNPEYSRSRVLARGFNKNNIKVICCQDRKPGIRKYLNLIIKHNRIREKYDFLLVGFPGWTVVWLAKLLTRKPIIYDAFLSVYESHVKDRKKYSPRSIKAKYCWFLDWLACKLADKILLDTDEHIKYFVKTFKIKKDKFIKVLVGTDDSVFYPRPSKKNNNFLIHFHATFIPLQGAKYIVKAAKILENNSDILFNFIGDKGQTYSGVRKLVKDLNIKNIRFFKSVPYEKLPDWIQKADVCLGIFGDTEKTQRVIPNKVYEAIAMKKPVITADTPAARELFTDRKNVLFCRAADPKDLADKILELKNNKDLREKIAQGGYEAFRRYAAPGIIAKRLLKDLTNRIAIYTAIFGGRDKLIKPKYLPKGCDFICFTDSDFKSNIWKVKKVKPLIYKDPVRSAKIYKILPHRFLADYDYSIWIDGNMLVRGDVNKLINQYLKNCNLAAFSHAQNIGDSRNCIYEEARALIKMAERGKYKNSPNLIKIIKKQIKHYESLGYPKNNGLIVGMVILRRHNEPDVIKTMEDWWKEIERYSPRDQLSFNYVAWRNKLKFAYMKGDSKNNEFFKRLSHKKNLWNRVCEFIDHRLVKEAHERN